LGYFIELHSGNITVYKSPFNKVYNLSTANYLFNYKEQFHTSYYFSDVYILHGHKTCICVNKNNRASCLKCGPLLKNMVKTIGKISD